MHMGSCCAASKNEPTLEHADAVRGHAHHRPHDRGVAEEARLARPEHVLEDPVAIDALELEHEHLLVGRRAPRENNIFGHVSDLWSAFARRRASSRLGTACRGGWRASRAHSSDCSG